MIKRFFDIVFSLFGLIVSSFILIPVIFLVWKQDKQLPFYISARVGKNQKLFNMVKLRSMIINADQSGVNSTGSNDLRITSIGHFIRNYKLDELTQLWNVLLGDMSLVGPRPNVKNETDLYTHIEKNLLSIKPGITDFSSIVFSDEGDILKNFSNPDLAYNQLIRPWKSRLGILYIENRSSWLDINLIFYTLVSIFSKKIALNWVVRKLKLIHADKEIINVAKRTSVLQPFPPPGLDKIIS
jgi:lipopolysaccharide/colanic/teichoic acid biosynthesis glycosyltransferase